MKPYYSHAGITIFLGDAREILPTLKCDAIVADPPYGIGYVHGAEKIPNASTLNEIPVVGDDAPFDPAFLLQRELPTILWGGNHYAPRLPASGGWLVWDKRCNTVVNDQSDAEIAWTNIIKTIRIYYHVWDGFRRQTEKDVPRVHPTQKPVDLMKWCLGFLPDDIGVVADPFMGSGATLVAAKQCGLQAIGIEIEERYAEIAAKRLNQEVLDFNATVKA